MNKLNTGNRIKNMPTIMRFEVKNSGGTEGLCAYINKGQSLLMCERVSNHGIWFAAKCSEFTELTNYISHILNFEFDSALDLTEFIKKKLFSFSD